MGRKFFTGILVLCGCMIFCQPVLFAAHPKAKDHDAAVEEQVQEQTQEQAGYTERVSYGAHYDFRKKSLTIEGLTVVDVPDVDVPEVDAPEVDSSNSPLYNVTMEQRGASMIFEVISLDKQVQESAEEKTEEMTEDTTQEQTKDCDELSGRPHYDFRHGVLHIPRVEVDGLEGKYEVTMKQRGASMNFQVTFVEWSDSSTEEQVQEPTTEEPTEEGGEPIEE